MVLRRAGPWSGTVLALLRHLEKVGFTGAPRVVGSGLSDDGREMLSYIEGESPHPHAWSDEGAASVGRLLAQLHAATRSFESSRNSDWHPWWGRDLPGTDRVIGHCDVGPWNIIARDGRAVAFVDWEFAGPVDAVWELVHAAWLNAQLYDDDLAERHGLPDTAARAKQLRIILDAYGLPRSEREGFVEKLIAFAVHDARAEAVNGAVTPETTSAVVGDSYPVLWAITWRVRSASWMFKNRALLEKAIG